MAEPIFQFGTSRFLQAHVDLFLSEAREAGQDVGRVTVVQTSGSLERAGRVQAFNDPAGYPVQIKGLDAGRVVDRVVQVTAVQRGLSTATDWPEILRFAAEDAGTIISNTADAGYALAPDARLDLSADPVQAPGSFPEKLLAVLASRHRAGGGDLTIYPCELIERNGDHLKRVVLDLAKRSGGSDALLTWLVSDCLWVNSLVDRIVSAPLEPLGAVAEPYALWAIETQPGLVPLCRHPAVTVVDDLAPIARRKLFLLNLAHTVLADGWVEAGKPAGTTVRELMDQDAVSKALRDLYDRELIPGFAFHGLETSARDYAATTMERFANPFLDHQLSDIFTNHREKVQRRVVAFLAWTEAAKLEQPRLRAIAARWR